MELFRDINKSDSINKILALLDSDKFPHSVILECKNKDDSMKVASDICKFFMCKNDDIPCGECDGCIKVTKGVHPDVFITGGTGSLRSIHIDVIRHIRQDVYIMPNEGKRKIYIINDANEMSPQAQNAFLKVLEEPPGYVVFILICQSNASLLDTIKSRCQSFVIDSEEDECVSNEVMDLTSKIALSIPDSDHFKTLSLTSQFVKNKDTFIDVLSELEYTIRDAIMISFDANVKLRHPIESGKLSEKITKNGLANILDRIYDTRAMLDQNVNYNLLLTLFSIYITKCS